MLTANFFFYDFLPLSWENPGEIPRETRKHEKAIKFLPSSSSCGAQPGVVVSVLCAISKGHSTCNIRWHPSRWRLSSYARGEYFAAKKLSYPPSRLSSPRPLMQYFPPRKEQQKVHVIIVVGHVTKWVERGGDDVLFWRITQEKKKTLKVGRKEAPRCGHF